LCQQLEEILKKADRVRIVVILQKADCVSNL